MSGGSLPAGMSPAISSAATPEEMAAGADPALGLSASAPQMTDTQLAMQGLLGALTGNAKYGENAPAIHKALSGFLQPQKSQGAPAAPQMRPRMGPGMAPGAMIFPGMMPNASVTAPNFQQGSMPAIQSLAPWLMGNGR